MKTRTLACLVLATAAMMAAGSVASQRLLSPREYLIARAKSFELATPYVPPPGS
jgi:ABC-type protease/lipase transport system fused ATPase/permease subunit